MRYGIVPNQRKSRLQQPQHPSHAIRPASLVCELSEDELGVCLRCCCEDDCRCCDPGCEGPEHCCNTDVLEYSFGDAVIERHSQAPSFHFPKKRYPKIFRPIAKKDMARKYMYVCHAVSCTALFDPATTAAAMNWALFVSFVSPPFIRKQFHDIPIENSPPKTASVVTSVNQPAILIHPTRKLWIG